MRLHSLRRSYWLVLGLLLFAFGLRVYGIEAVRHDFDRAYPHGAGIGIVENIAAGQWQNLPTLSLRSNINLPNPALTSYLWAGVAAFPAGRDPYVVTFANVALNVLALAMLADLARRLMGKHAAILALAFAASSLWSVYLAQGAWLQGLLEFSATFSLWAIVRAWQSGRPWRILLALCAAALVMHTYLLAFGLLAQILALGMIGFVARKNRSANMAFVIGTAICLLGLAFFAILVYRDTPNILSQLQSGVNNASAARNGESVPNPFGVSNTFAAFYHAVGVITGRFYEDMWANTPDSYFGLRDWLSNIRAIFIETLFAVGVLSALWRRRFGDWVALAWFFVPVIGITLLTLFLSNLAVFHHYMMITAPGGYLLASAFLGQNKLFSPISAFSSPKWLFRILTFFVAMCLLGVPALNFITHVAHNRATPFDEQQAASLDTLAIQHLRQIGTTWRNDCGEIANPQHPNWVASVLGRHTNIRPASVTRSNLPHRGSAEAWHVSPNSTSCLTRITPPTPRSAEPLPSTVANVNTYRQRADQVVLPSNPACDNTPLAINLGWSQRQVCSPPQITAGEAIQVRFVWEIGGLPPAHIGYQKWRYEPFVKLINPHGQVVLNAEGAGVLGEHWRAGDLIISEVNFTPPNLPAGIYRLEISLFDREQSRNAWWLKPDQLNGPPINAIYRAVEIKN